MLVSAWHALLRGEVIDVVNPSVPLCRDARWAIVPGVLVQNPALAVCRQRQAAKSVMSKEACAMLACS